MGDADLNDRVLTSWKEIAGFLQVSPRTAQQYEKTRGLRVGRMGTRPAVLESELRAWQAAGLQYPAWWERVAVLQVWALSATVLLVAVAAGLWWMWRTTRGSGDPVDVRWSGSVLTAFDGKSRPLWTRAFPYPVMGDGNWDGLNYRMADLDHDGRVEVVLGYPHVRRETEGLDLYCLSATGAEKWRYAVGRDVADRRQAYRPPYVLREFSVFPSPEKDGSRWVAAVFVHHTSSPAVLVVLDSGGKVRGEYWHPGHLNTVLTLDLDGDGISEILAGGVRHGVEQAVMLVFDPRDVHGTAQIGDSDERQMQGLGRGTEKAVVYFPRTAVNKRVQQFNILHRLEWVNGAIQATVYELLVRGDSGYLVYTLGRDFAVQGIMPSVSYKNASGELSTGRAEVEKGLVDGELERMKREVRVERR